MFGKLLEFWFLGNLVFYWGKKGFIEKLFGWKEMFLGFNDFIFYIELVIV